MLAELFNSANMAGFGPSIGTVQVCALNEPVSQSLRPGVFAPIRHTIAATASGGPPGFVPSASNRQVDSADVLRLRTTGPCARRICHQTKNLTCFRRKRSSGLLGQKNDQNQTRTAPISSLCSIVLFGCEGTCRPRAQLGAFATRLRKGFLEAACSVRCTQGSAKKSAGVPGAGKAGVGLSHPPYAGICSYARRGSELSA